MRISVQVGILHVVKELCILKILKKIKKQHNLMSIFKNKSEGIIKGKNTSYPVLLVHNRAYILMCVMSHNH